MSASDTVAEGVAVTPLKRPAPKPAPRVFDAGNTEPVSPEMAQRLKDLRVRYSGLSGPALLEAMIAKEFAGDIAAVSSFGSESVVILHMLAQIDPTVPVIFLNTGKLFGETLRYRDRLQDVLKLTDLRAVGPHPRDEAASDPEGTLWARDPDACCAFRKVAPLNRALAGFSAQITGRKRFQTQSRLSMPTIEATGGIFKINPLAEFSLEDLNAYIDTHRLPRHPLSEDGYPSIGCMPCTRRVKEGEGYRDGRWSGFDKDECGIHTNVGGDGI